MYSQSVFWNREDKDGKEGSFQNNYEKIDESGVFKQKIYCFLIRFSPTRRRTMGNFASRKLVLATFLRFINKQTKRIKGNITNLIFPGSFPVFSKTGTINLVNKKNTMNMQPPTSRKLITTNLQRTLGVLKQYFNTSS